MAAFHPPSDIIAGASASMQTVSPERSSSPEDPVSMWNASATRQRSSSPAAVRPEVEHGQAMSQLQFSKYVPAISQLIVVSLLPGHSSLVLSSERVNDAI